MLISSIGHNNYPHIFSDKHIAAKMILECIGECDWNFLEDSDESKQELNL